MDFWRGPHHPYKAVDIMVDPKFQEDLEQTLHQSQMPYNVMIDNVQDVINGEHGDDKELAAGRDSLDYSKYHTYEEVSVDFKINADT